MKMLFYCTLLVQFHLGMINGCIGIAGLKWFVHISNGIFFVCVILLGIMKTLFPFSCHCISTQMAPAAGIAPCGRQGHIYPTMPSIPCLLMTWNARRQGISTYGINVFLRDIPVLKTGRLDLYKFGLWRYLFKKAARWQDLCRGAGYHVMISPPVGHVSRRPLLELNFSCSPTILMHCQLSCHQRGYRVTVT